MKINWKTIQWSKKRAAAVAAVLLVLGLIAAGILSQGQKTESVYKETRVQYGTLVVGVTESGAVDIGTVEQTFDLDMSALQRVSTDGYSSGSNTGSSTGGGMFGAGAMSGGGGMDVFSQLMNMGGNNLQSFGEDSSLTISGVCVSVGQQVSEGDVLYELEKESVAELEEKLQSNVQKAQADLEAVYAEQELSKVTAQYNYESSIAYGGYAETEYEVTLWNLQNTLEQSQLSLQRAQETLDGYTRQLEVIEQAYQEAVAVLQSCEDTLDHIDPEDDMYGYVYYYDAKKDALSNVNSLEQKKEQLEKNIEQSNTKIQQLTKSYHQAARNLEQGRLSAEQTRQLRQLALENAQETYDITLAYLEDDAAEQESIYQETQEKWEEFSSYIDGNFVCSLYNGVVTSVELEEGDSIRTGSLLVTLYDMDEVTMTVSVLEEDMTDIKVGSAANISLIAYPEEIFQAQVTEISDASSDSNGNIYYDVTVTILGDVSGLFQSMTGEITFVTQQTQDVLYVSKRAVITQEEKSYVKVKDEKGNISKKEVTTGFSDGVNIEIIEGLSEGETVLIESKVSGS